MQKKQNGSFLWLFLGMPRMYVTRVSAQTAQTRDMGVYSDQRCKRIPFGIRVLHAAKSHNP